VIPKASAQLMLAMIFGGITLRAVYFGVRTREHDTWLSSVYPVLTGLSLFVVLLPADKALPAFYLITLSYLFTLALSAHAFLDRDYHHKGPISISLIALMGAPPLVMGERFYRLIHEIIETGNLLAGVLMIVIWFGLSMASTQIIGKVLLSRRPHAEKRALFSGEVFFLCLYLIGIISLTAFHEQIVALLNEHPLSNLW
jgi:hypothetical protein